MELRSLLCSFLQGGLAMAGVPVAEVTIERDSPAVWSHPHQLLLGGHSSSLFQEVWGDIRWSIMNQEIL